MPVRGVRSVPAESPRQSADVRTSIARWITFGGAFFLTVGLTIAMASAFWESAPPILGSVFLALFAATVGWIAFSATSVCAGFVTSRRRPWPEAAPEGRVGLVMPIYNEDAAAVAAGLLAMGRGLDECHSGIQFEIVVLSDTTEPDAWARETAAIAWLRNRLGGKLPVWYRRRARNVARKSGNVAEFVERIGGRYASFVMLDADSLLEPATLVTLARRMAGDPDLGLLQTVPELVGAVGVLPRAQEFASACYGPAIARGVAAWSGPDGNYWGHNAIIRTCAFADACGLPVLVGRRPFGGPILSHDFAEAAWMRRAGWSVRMDPELGGSYESGPPTLLDIAVRDRRWMQGNFQHASLLAASGLRPLSRFHLINGIASYTASPLWMALLVTGGILTYVARSAEHRYFAEPHQLVPDWPRFDTTRMMAVFAATFALLLFPKVLAVGQWCARRIREGRIAGAARLVVAAVLETLTSALVAPILMWSQSRQALDILRGRDSGWTPQSRRGVTSWADAVRWHAGQTLTGLAVIVLCFRTEPELLLWASPVVAGLVLSIPLSRWSGACWRPTGPRRPRIFDAPRGTGDSPTVLEARDELLPLAEKELAGYQASSIWSKPGGVERHLASVEPRPVAPRGAPDIATLSAGAKLCDAVDVHELLGWLDREEKLALLSAPNLVRAAVRLLVIGQSGGDGPPNAAVGFSIAGRSTPLDIGLQAVDEEKPPTLGEARRRTVTRQT